MLVIRFQRIGKKKQAFFRVVLQEKKWQPKGKAKELLGFYNPHTKEKTFQKERIEYWLSHGAQASPTVHNLLIDEKIIKGFKVKAWIPRERKSPEVSAKEEKKKKKDAEQTQTDADKKESVKTLEEVDVKTSGVKEEVDKETKKVESEKSEESDKKEGVDA